MRRVPPYLAFTLLPVIALCHAGTVARAAQAKVETLATFEGGPSLQSVDRARDGSLYLTDYAHDLLLKIDPHGRSTTFVAKLPLHPQGIMVTRSGFLVTGHANAPSSDHSLTLTQRFQHVDGRLLVLDAAGVIIKTLELGENAFPNGMARLDDRFVLIADSLAGAVWKVDPEAGTVVAWTRDPLVAPEPSFPGANGIKIQGGWVYVSNTAKNEIVRFKLGPHGDPDGPGAVFAPAPKVDELVVAKDGTIYAASHGPMLKISPAGAQTTAFDSVPGGSALLMAPDRKSLFVTTDAVSSNGVKGPGSVLRVWLN